MKLHLIYIVALFITLSDCCAQNSERKDSVFTAFRCNTSQLEPFYLLKGSHFFRVECDTVFVINKVQRDIYRLRGTLIAEQTQKGSLQASVISSYEKSLLGSEEALSRLYNQYQKLDSTSQSFAKDTKGQLGKTAVELQNVSTHLESASEHIDSLEKAIKEERRKTFWQKILIGAGGVGIGLVVGILASGG